MRTYMKNEIILVIMISFFIYALNNLKFSICFLTLVTFCEDLRIKDMRVFKIFTSYRFNTYLEAIFVTVMSTATGYSPLLKPKWILRNLFV